MEEIMLRFISLVFVTFCSYTEGNDEIWVQTPDDGHFSAFNTRDIYNNYTSLSTYDLSPTFLRNVISVRVSSFGAQCAVAFILLSEAYDLQTSKFYEFYFGETNMILRKGYGSDALTKAYPNNITVCDEFRQLSINWTSNGFFTIRTKDHVVSNLKDAAPYTIRGIGIKSGYGNEAVWAIKFTGNFVGAFCGKTDTYGHMTILERTYMVSKVACSGHCSQSFNCIGFNYNIITKKCELIDKGQLIQTFSSINWFFYAKCWDEFNVCSGCV